jgi:peptide chain release factor subunit 1
VEITPPKPIPRFDYQCDKQFHIEPLRQLLDDDDKFGFLIISGDTTLFGTVCGSSKQTLYEFEADLPKKHNKGGQSSVRFARLRVEKRHNYLRKVGELATQYFITDNKANVKGMIVAGFAQFKCEFMDGKLLDPRLKAIVLKVVDVGYGSQSGFNQAIELADDVLSNVKLMEHRKIILSFFQEIEKDTRKWCFGVRDTMMALEAGAVETLILWEELKIRRCESEGNEGKVTYLKEGEESEGQGEGELLTDWMAQHYEQFGVKLVFVTDSSSEGSQFCKGFGGFGGLLRYPIELPGSDDEAEEGEDENEVDFL